MKALRQRERRADASTRVRGPQRALSRVFAAASKEILPLGARLDARFGRALSPLPGRRRGCSMRIPAGEERRRNWIGGAWVPPSTDKYDPCVNPADTREAAGEFPKSGAADAKAAVDAAAKAVAGGSATPGPGRGRALPRAAAR